MEKKERYGITDAHYLCDSAIFNTETNDMLRLYQICDLLNQQDKRIKELEEELENYKFCRCVDCSLGYEKGLETSIDELEKENQHKKELTKYKSYKTDNERIKDLTDLYEKYATENKQLKQQLEEKDRAIENWQTMYESVVQTCHNDKEEIERLNKQLETQENTITNLIEDNRASQEWYKKQLAYTEAQNKRVLEKLDIIVRSNQELEKENQQLKDKLHTSEQETLHFHNKYFAEKQIAIEELNKVRETAECVLDNALKNSSLNQSYYDRLLDEINNQINELMGEK